MLENKNARPSGLASTKRKQQNIIYPTNDKVSTQEETEVSTEQGLGCSFIEEAR